MGLLVVRVYRIGGNTPGRDGGSIDNFFLLSFGPVIRLFGFSV